VIHTDLSLSGAVAQYGRGVGMIQATAEQIIGQFAGNLRAQLAQQPAASPDAVQAPPMPPLAKPISGLSLVVRVMWSKLTAMFGRGGDEL
jgi:hypothetical protein